MNTRNMRIIGVALLLIVILCGYALYRYEHTAVEKTAVQPTMQTGNTVVDALLVKLQKHMPIPTGGPVSVYTIHDPANLAKQQAFFEGSSEGDDLVVFPQAHLAIVYSPTKDAIIHIGPIMGNASSTATTTTQ